MRCELVSWYQVYQLSRKLAYEIKRARFHPDMIVAIARGGYVPARILCDFLEVYALASLRVEHYKRGAQKQESARVASPLGVDTSGQRVLIVDDVADTGDTFEIAEEHVRQSQPLEIRTAVLHYKVASSYTPDFWSTKVKKWRWLIYPWAVIEDIKGFVEQMEYRPTTVEILKERLTQDYRIKVSEQTLEDVRHLLGESVTSH